MRNSLQEKHPDAHHMISYFHKCSSDCSSQRRKLSTKKEEANQLHFHLFCFIAARHE